MNKNLLKSNQTKQKIIDSFLLLLKNKPIQEITIKELCQHAKINRGTFYLHYIDIYDLLEQIENKMFTEFKSALAIIEKDQDKLLDPVELTTKIFKLIQENKELTLITLGKNGDISFKNKLLDHAKTIFLSSYAQYFQTTDIEIIDYYFTFISFGCLAILEKWLNEEINIDQQRLIKLIETIIINSLDKLLKA